jgi:hypothetical protein
MIKHAVRSLLATAVLTAFVSPAVTRADEMPGMGAMGPKAIERSQTTGPYRVRLVHLPAEPFVTAADVHEKHLTSGMLVIRGATPVQPGAPSHPNHHLVVHVYNRVTSEPLHGATIRMTYAAASNAAAPVTVPIVEMQAVGKGPASTHYGNNVTLTPGEYHVSVTVNGKATTTFTVAVPG